MCLVTFDCQGEHINAVSLSLPRIKCKCSYQCTIKAHYVLIITSNHYKYSETAKPIQTDRLTVRSCLELLRAP